MRSSYRISETSKHIANIDWQTVALYTELEPVRPQSQLESLRTFHLRQGISSARVLVAGRDLCNELMLWTP
jgi:hypothetical protein